MSQPRVQPLDLQNVASPGSQRARSPSPSASANGRGGGGGGRINLDNFLVNNPGHRGGRVLTSPRSLEVCARFGIEPSDLLPRPLESFMSQTPRGQGINSQTARMMAQRRYDHFETNRMRKLAVLKEERQALVKRDDEETPQRAQTPRSPRGSVTGGATPSPARLNMMQNAKMQEMKYKLLQMERNRNNAERTAKLDEALEVADSTKNEKLCQVAEKNSQKWDQVQQTNQHAHMLQDSRNKNAAERLNKHEHDRELQKSHAETKRTSEWKFKSISRRQHLEEVQNQERERFEARNRKAKCHWEHVEERAMTAEERQAQLLSERAARNMDHSEHVLDTNVKAKMMEDSAYVEKSAKQTAAEREIEQKLTIKAMVERDLHQKRLMEKEQAVRNAQNKEATLRTQKKSKLSQWQMEKAEKFRQLQEQLAEEKLWALEGQRERIEDHVQEVRRVKRAKEYERKAKVIETLNRKEDAFRAQADFVRQQTTPSGAACTSLLSAGAQN